MTLAYVTTDQEEYIIPFTLDEEESVESGKVYSVENFFKRIGRTYSENITKKERDLSGGLLRRSSMSAIKYTSMVNVGILLSIGLILFITKRKRGRRKQI